MVLFNLLENAAICADTGRIYIDAECCEPLTSSVKFRELLRVTVSRNLVRYPLTRKLDYPVRYDCIVLSIWVRPSTSTFIGHRIRPATVGKLVDSQSHCPASLDSLGASCTGTKPRSLPP